MNKPSLRKSLKELAKKMEAKIRQKAVSDKTVYKGTFSKSFDVDVLEDGLAITSSAEYARAIIDGTGPAKREMSHSRKVEKWDRLGDWAKSKGMRPLMRDKKGRFRKLNRHSYRQLGYVLSRSIAKKGIIKRYNYNGSKILDRVYKEMSSEIGAEITEAYMDDIKLEIRRILNISTDGSNIS